MSAADRINARDAEIESEEFVALFTPPPAAPSPAAAGLPLEDVERVARAIASEAIAVTLVTDDEWDFYLRPDEQEDYRRLAAAALAEMRPTAAVEAVKRVEALRDEVSTWIDEAPEHTAGLDLLRQIIAPVPPDANGGEER